MRATKILTLLLILELIAFVYISCINNEEKDQTILEEISHNNKYKISLTEVQHLDSKSVDVNFYYKKTENGFGTIRMI